MKANNIRKILAITKLKFKMLSKNTAAMCGPLMAIGMTVIMRLLYTSMADGDGETMDFLMGMALNFGLCFNIGMGAIMMSALPLAEDKEKYTLRALMTSSVNGTQFFIGSLIPSFLITVFVNYILIFVSGVVFANINFLMFSIITIIGSLISCMLGLLIGILAKSQVNANNLMMPFVLVLSMIPTFASINTSMENISGYLYTGITSNMVDAFVSGNGFQLEIQQIIVLFASAIICTALFLYAYRKNGLETE